jgi:hypothetical protein
MDEHPDFSKDPPVLNITSKDYNTDFLSLEPTYAIDPQVAGQGNSTTVSMCPATEYWQEKMANASDKIVNELDFDGIYYD